MGMALTKGINNLMELHPMSISLTVLIVATIGVLLQIGGTSWDVTSHLLQRPETFFTPSHTVLYTGVGLLVITAVIGGNLLRKSKDVRNKSFATAFKLFVIGSAISLVAGPADYLWHQTFGVDGLLSPTHLTLITGMLINSIAVVLGLTRIFVHFSAGLQRLVKAALVPAFAGLWLTMTWYVYMFALPISNGVHFNFNLNPSAESLIAIIALPLVGSMVFILASRAIGRFGGASAVAAVLIGIIVFTNITPSDHLTPFLPWYLMLLIPAVLADLVLNRPGIRSKIGLRESQLIAGAIIGSAFYVLGYPMLSMTFVNLLLGQGAVFLTPLFILNFPNFLSTLPTALTITMVPGAVMGIIGAIISSQKIAIPQEENILKEIKY